VAHTQTPEVWAERNAQLRTRLWELGNILEATLELDTGDEHILLSNMNRTTPVAALSQFAGMLDVVDPGKVIWAGHSFGAASMVQLLKSTYYAGRPELEAMTDPLFNPRIGSNIHRQITETCGASRSRLLQPSPSSTCLCLYMPTNPLQWVAMVFSLSSRATFLSGRNTST